MRKISTLLIGLSLLLLSAVQAQPAAATTDYFVSKTGSNQNSGTLAKPFLTIQKCATVTSSKHNCKILSGTYFETIVSNSNVSYTPYQNATVTIDGRKTVTGFQKYSQNQYVASVSLSSGSTNQIFFDDKEGVLAQWPNGGDDFHPSWAHLQTGTNTTQIVDQSIPESLAGVGVAKIWSGNDAWAAQTASFNKIKDGNLQITLDGDHLDQQITPNSGGLYYLFDNLKLLDNDFEWFYDRTAKKLYVQIPANKEITDFKIQAKVRDVAFDLRNKHNVIIQGLRITASTIASNMSSHDNVIDGIKASFVSQETRLRDDKVQHPWPGGFDFDRNFDTGIMVKGSRNILKNSEITHSACNGVVVSGDHNTVTNNLISDVDRLFNNCSGVYLTGDHETITHNTIFNTGRSAIFPTNVWNPTDNVKSVAVTNSDISFNDLFNTALLGNDIGAIYMGGGVFTGLKIHHNWIHDSHFPKVRPSGPWPQNNISGVYLDEDSSGVEVFQNYLWNLDFRSIFINGANKPAIPNNNLIHNNSIPDSAKYAHINLGGPIANCGTTAVFNNRVLVPVNQEYGSACKVENNSATSVGANELEGITPGCNLAFCAVDPFKPNPWK